MLKISGQRLMQLLAIITIALTLSGCDLVEQAINQSSDDFSEPPIPQGPPKWIELQDGKDQDQGYRIYYNDNSIAISKEAPYKRTVQQLRQFDDRPNSSLLDIIVKCSSSGSGLTIHISKVRWYDQRYAKGNLLETENNSKYGNVFPVTTDLEWNFVLAVCGKDL